jgi:hypothetical protein
VRTPIPFETATAIRFTNPDDYFVRLPFRNEGQVTELKPLRNIRMEFVAEALYFWM